MVVPHKAVDLQAKDSIFSTLTRVFFGSRRQTPSSVDLQEVDLAQLDINTLRGLATGSQSDNSVLVHYARKASREGRVDDVLAAVTINPEAILDHCPEVAAQYLVIHRGSHEVFSADQLFRLGQWCESSNKTSYALSIYEQWELAYFDLPELETVTYKAANLWWHEMANAKRTLQKLEIIQRKFRNGQYALQAEQLRDEILGVGQDKRAA